MSGSVALPLLSAIDRPLGRLRAVVVPQRLPAQSISRIARHDDGWAYTVDGVFSEPFPTHAAALAAARTAAAEQRMPGHTETIEYEDEKGHWHTETAAGSDRPDTDVEDTN